MPQGPTLAATAKNPSGVAGFLATDSSGNLKVAGQSGGTTAATVANGADATQGAIADTAWTGTGSGTVVAILKAIFGRLPPSNSAKNYAANTAGDAAKTGAGVLAGLTINTAGATSTATLYDGTSTAGTKLATINTTAVGSINFNNIAFATGLFVVLAGGTPADVTVVYR
ncbi:MAG: hypothetical protein WDN25_13400 [Acetobacteraceae bacterium]